MAGCPTTDRLRRVRQVPPTTARLGLPGRRARQEPVRRAQARQEPVPLGRARARQEPVPLGRALGP